jgi:CheY-like chemotaxis protein
MDERMRLSRPINILLVEDSEADVVLTQEAFAEAKVVNELHVVKDGVEAMAFLRGEGPYAGKPMPDVVLLDLNMPRMDGRQVLHEMRQDPRLTLIPVVVLTTSKAEEDVVRAYSLRANCYITKPVDFGQFMHVVQSIEGFWLSVVTLPPHQP